MTIEAGVLSLGIDPALGGALRAALVWGLGLPACPPTGEAPAYLVELIAKARDAGEAFLPPERKASVRGMLRHGKYKPAGRSKPSSEYLLAAALEGEGPLGAFPLVNGPVDANNAASLEWGYPASVFDLAKTGPALFLRYGLGGEAYVFNPSGQEIELEDLAVACRRTAKGDWDPCGNPVKDAMATKVFEEARDVAAIVYAPVAEPASGLEACAARLAWLFAKECGAGESGYRLCEGRAAT